MQRNSIDVYLDLLKMKRFRLIVCLLLFQIAAFTAYASSKQFTNINNLHGISMRETNSVVQDDYGFVWVSSKTGILRLTEDSHRLYQLDYERADIISLKLVYSNSILMAYTNNGQLFRYNNVLDRFEMIENFSHAFWGLVNVLIVDANELWLVSTSGLYKYSNQELTFVGNDHSIIHAGIWRNTHQLVLARGNTFELFDIKTNKFQTIYTNSDIPSFEVSNLYLDTELNRLWIGTLSSGLFYYEFATGVFKGIPIKSFPNQPILAIESSPEASILVGIDGQGVWELDRDGQKIINIYKENNDNPTSLRGNGVYDIFCDSNKRVWICTFTGGVSYYESQQMQVVQINHQINNPNSLADNDVNCIIEDSRGNLWFATNNGISCLDVELNQWRNFYVNNRDQAQVFLTLCEDNRGRIWAGTYSSGVYILDGRTGRELSHFSKKESGSPFSNDYVFDIYKDSRGDIWVGGINSEVIRCDTHDDQFQKYSVQPLFSFAELPSERMLFGCSYGISLSDNKSGKAEVLKYGFVAHDLIVIDNIAWIATSGDGLIRFDLSTKQQQEITTQDGLPTNFLNSIVQMDGFLWIGTENGLCKYDPDNNQVVVFTAIKSLGNVSFNRGAHCKLRNGKLAMGTSNGVVIFNPQTFQMAQPNGKIFFQELSISGRSVRENSSFKLKTPLDELENIKLKYNQNTFTLELLPIGVAAGAKFSWKLEGFDQEWTQPSSHRLLNYSNIPNKKYQLKIRMYDNSLSQILAERTVQVKVTPPFWGTWWFMIVVFLVISFLIFYNFWSYINHLKQIHAEDKVRFFTSTAHEIRTSLTLIKAPIEELSKETSLSEHGRYFLELTIGQVRKLSKVVTQLMDFQKIDSGNDRLNLENIDVVELITNRIVMFKTVALNKNLKIKFQTNIAYYETAIDEAQIEKVIDNLISNAIKYAFPNTSIQIRFKSDETQWSIEVADKGIGISKKAQGLLFKEFYRAENAINSKIIGSGIGLLLAKNYVELHGGTIQFESQENEGSKFRFSIPFKQIEGKETKPTNAADELLPFEPQALAEPTELQLDENPNEKETRILIVEDNDDLRQFLYHALGSDFEITMAEDGLKAWELISQSMPDMVVSDVMMPNMDGFELCRKIKSTYETSHIPIILLTALTEKTDELHGLGLGADDYLSKPFDTALLVQRIKSIVKNRESVREKALKLIKTSSEEPLLSNEHNDKFLKKVQAVVLENISNSEFGKDQFAERMNVSPSLLYKKIKALTDLSPSDYIKTVRLDYALELLQSRKYSVTEVSEKCGYTSLKYFSAVFKKHFGKAPSELL